MKEIGGLKRSVKLDSGTPIKDFKVSASGTAGSDVSYDVVISGTLYFKPKGFLSVFKTEERGLKSLSNGIEIMRGFSVIARVKDLKNNEYMVPQSLSDKKELQVGDELLVKVKFKADDNFEYLVLEDFLPSGFEVTKTNAYDLYTPFVHSERWDNRMVFFFTRLQKGKIYEVAYVIRAELPGKYMVRPARMECMYEPGIQGWSVPTVVEVMKK
jgi:uncharacterized protein YfaS (alpha-2-macroglobulin family)